MRVYVVCEPIIIIIAHRVSSMVLKQNVAIHIITIWVMRVAVDAICIIMEPYVYHYILEYYYKLCSNTVFF